MSSGTWVVLGSSTAAGYGSTSKSWVQGLGDAYSGAGVSMVNLAVPGATTYAGLPASSLLPVGAPSAMPWASIDAALTYAPKLVLLSFPTNDTADGVSLAQTLANFKVIIADAKVHGAAVVVLSTQPRDLTDAQLADLAVLDDRLQAMAAPCFVPVRAALAGPDGRLAAQYDSGDHVHPNDAGHALINSKVVSLIDSGACVKAR